MLRGKSENSSLNQNISQLYLVDSFFQSISILGQNLPHYEGL